MERVAVVAGATGLIGSHLVDALLASEQYARVAVLVRGPFTHPDARVVPILVDFANLQQDSIPAGTADAFCTLGTTIKVAGSESAFRAVDFDAVVRFAQAAHAAGASGFHVVSAMGADANSRIFYNRVKGEMERAAAGVGFARVHVHRPSLLLGEREVPRRGERVGAAVLGAIGPLLRGGLSNYRAIDALVVARAMTVCAMDPAPGIHVHASGELQRLGLR